MNKARRQICNRICGRRKPGHASRVLANTLAGSRCSFNAMLNFCLPPWGTIFSMSETDNNRSPKKIVPAKDVSR